MKMRYETPSMQIERFDLKDPDIVASGDETVWSDETVVDWFTY